MAVRNFSFAVGVVFMMAMLSSELFHQMLKGMRRLVQYRKGYCSKHKKVYYEQAFFHSRQM